MDSSKNNSSQSSFMIHYKCAVVSESAETPPETLPVFFAVFGTFLGINLWEVGV